MVKLVQPEKQEIEVTDSEIVTDVKPVHLEKALLPIVVTEFGMIIEVNPLQPSKAEIPIDFTDWGIVIYKIMCNGGRVAKCCIMLHYT